MKTAPVIALTLLPLVALSDVPMLVDYQGYLTDLSGTPVHGQANIEIGLWSHPSGTDQDDFLFSETHASTPVEQGLFNIAVGGGFPAQGQDPLEPDVFGAEVWLEVVVNGETLVPRRQITTQPFAIRTLRAESVDSNGVGSGAVIDNTLRAADLAEEGGGDFLHGPSLTQFDFFNVGEDVVLVAVPLTVPAAGMLMASATTVVRTLGATSGKCDITTASFVDTSPSMEFAFTVETTTTLAATKAFAVPAGSVTVRLVCKTQTTSPFDLLNPVVTVVWVPTFY